MPTCKDTACTHLAVTERSATPTSPTFATHRSCPPSSALAEGPGRGRARTLPSQAAPCCWYSSWQCRSSPRSPAGRRRRPSTPKEVVASYRRRESDLRRQEGGEFVGENDISILSNPSGQVLNQVRKNNKREYQARPPVFTRN